MQLREIARVEEIGVQPAHNPDVNNLQHEIVQAILRNQRGEAETIFKGWPCPC
jgi:hypothetical protein